MIAPDKNRLLTEIGPGAPMGDLLRRYWHPIGGISEFDDSAIKPVRFFGEDLVLFRTLSGEFGLIARHCAHRNSDLTFGIIEEHGLRCSYHGWQYDPTGQCTHQPFEETLDPSAALRKRTCLPAYPVQVKAGMIWAYMGPAPAPLLPDWEAFSWANCFSQVVLAEIPCNWLQCQENTVDPVHFEWMHNNQPQRAAGDFGPYSPTHLRLGIDDFEFGLISRRYRKGTDESAPLWSVGRAILWPNGWYFGHHFEWKVPIDDTNTLFVTWATLHVPHECEPYEQTRIPTWRAPVKDGNGDWIRSHVGNQDIVAWVSQGPINDRSREMLGASDRGVSALRRQLFKDLDAVAEGRDPRGIIRDPARNQRIELPCVDREPLKNGLPAEEMANHPTIGPFLQDFFILAGQPDDVRRAFEQAMRTKREAKALHAMVPQ